MLADPLPELSFYVRLRLGHAEVGQGGLLALALASKAVLQDSVQSGGPRCNTRAGQDGCHEGLHLAQVLEGRAHGRAGCQGRHAQGKAGTENARMLDTPSCTLSVLYTTAESLLRAAIRHSCLPVMHVQIELLQVGPRGDLVVGSDQLSIDSITTKGTVVHWFQLKAADEELAAELCMVLRFLPGELLCVTVAVFIETWCMPKQDTFFRV